MITVLDNNPKFQFKQRSSKKISYERRAYESVDDKRIFWAMYVPKDYEKRNSWLKGLKKERNYAINPFYMFLKSLRLINAMENYFQNNKIIKAQIAVFKRAFAIHFQKLW